jgi:Cep192 domain 4/HYDIN/CFA65/VesB-like, Ig-like domain
MKTLFTIILAVLISGSAFAESKKMTFVEEYTSGYCTPCYDFDKIFYSTNNQYPNDVIPISIHAGVEPGDNMYRANTMVGDRFAYAYDTNSIFTPSIWVDGTKVEATQYATSIGDFTGGTSPVTIYLVDDRSVDGRINLKAIVQSDIVLSPDHKVAIFVREDEVYDPTPESGDPYVKNWSTFNWVAREILPSNTGQSINIKTSGGLASVETSVSIKDNWVMDKIKTFAIVQNIKTKEVLQAAWALTDLSVLKPEIASDNSTLDFGDVSEFADETVVLTNTGPGDLTISDMMIEDDAKGYFSILNKKDEDIVLKPGRDRSFKIRYFPKENGVSNAKLVVMSDAASNPKYTIQLKGSASNLVEFPQISFTSESYDFGDVSGSASFNMEIFNMGTGDLLISDMYVDGDEDEDVTLGLSETKNITIEAGGKLTFPITFSPKTNGYLIADLIIESNSKTDSEFWFGLSGKGVDVDEKGTISIIIDGGNGENILDFGEAKMGERKSFKIENSGNVNLTISTILFKTGQNSDMFKLIGTTILIDLAPNEKHEVEIEFNPTESGTFTSDLEITYGEDFQVASVKITGSADFSSISDDLSSGGMIEYKISPNPITDNALFEYNLGENISGNISFKLFDINGNLISNLNSSRAVANGIGSFLIDGSGLNSGKYFIVIELMGKAERVPIIINK